VKLLKNLIGYVFGQDADAFRVPLPPVEALDLIAENGTLHRQARREDNFERITFDWRRDRAEDR
jgi:hypothetical protein